MECFTCEKADRSLSLGSTAAEVSIASPVCKMATQKIWMFWNCHGNLKNCLGADKL